MLKPTTRALLRMACAVLLLALASCASNATPVTACDQLCDELVDECDYPAFPDRTSCLEGCLYNESEGADTDAHLSCVEEAACNTFTILECENQHGASSDD
jgi:hypothetical protein